MLIKSNCGDKNKNCGGNSKTVVVFATPHILLLYL